MKEDMISYRKMYRDGFSGKWYKRFYDDCYYIIEAVDMDEATGETDQGKYMFIVQTVCLDCASPGHLESALSYTGFDGNPNITDLIKVESLGSAGYCDVETSVLTNSFDRTLRKLKEQY